MIAYDLDVLLQQQLDAIVRAVRDAHAQPSQGPVVSDVLYTVDRNWAGDDAVHFTVITRDPPGREYYEWSELAPITEQVYALVREHQIERLPYVSFQLESERSAVVAASHNVD